MIIKSRSAHRFFFTFLHFLTNQTPPTNTNKEQAAIPSLKALVLEVSTSKGASASIPANTFSGNLETNSCLSAFTELRRLRLSLPLPLLFLSLLLLDFLRNSGCEPESSRSILYTRPNIPRVCFSLSLSPPNDDR